MSSRQDAKNEKILRELLRLPDNKRCPNCDSLGPQYVVSQFHIFVCTVCSGVHRQFGHRVKGVSMSTFKPEEITALKKGGNGPFVAHYLAKWTQSQLPKPTDRNVDRIREWIQAVYEGKRFFDADKQYVAATERLHTHSHSSKSEGKEVLVRQLSDVLGSGTPKLVVSRTDSLDKAPVKSVVQNNEGHIVNLLDVASPKASAPASTASNKSSAAPPAGAGTWDAFAAAPAAKPAPAVAADAWAAFGDSSATPASAGPTAAAATSNGAKHPPAAQVPSNGGWEAFGEHLPAVSSAGSEAVAVSSPSKPPLSPQRLEQRNVQQQPKKEERKEVPLDIFFPEFEQIRATGLLPNGQPALVPLRPQGYGGYGGQSYSQQSFSGGHTGYSQQQAAAFQAKAGTGAAPRPTVVIPTAPVYSVGAVPSSAGILPSPSSVASPNSFGMPTYTSAGGVSPAGSAGSFQPHVNGGVFGHVETPGIRSSVSSDGGIGAVQQQSVSDPFSSLAPGFKAVLPSYGSGNQIRMPSPTPGAGMPKAAPYVNGQGAYVPPSPVGPAVAPLAGSPFGSSSLFSGPPSLSAMPYDLSAPAAPKPKATGNPFA